jgi:hypothetical protein
VEVENVTDRRFVPVREVYGSSSRDGSAAHPGLPDTRATSALDYIERRTNREGRGVFMSLRKNF